MPSRLIGCQLRLRLFDDRLELFLGATVLLSLPRGRATRGGQHAHVVSYHHVIHSLRCKPFRRRRTFGSTALMGLVYRDQLFPRRAFRDMFALLLEKVGDREACRTMVGLLALAHDRGCEADLAAQLEEDLRQTRLPDLAALQTLFAPATGSLPGVEIRMGQLASYDSLPGNCTAAAEVGA